MVDIYFSDLKRIKVYQLPILPEVMPELSKSAKNEEFETFNNGVYNLIGSMGLVTFSIDSFLPEFGDKYEFAKSKIDPYLLINMWSGAMRDKIPIRCIMQRGEKSNNTEIINWMVTVESMVWFENRVGDIKYTVDFKEYRAIV